METSTFKFPSFLYENLVRKYFSSTRPGNVNILHFNLLHFNIFTLFWISWPHGRSWPGTTFSPSKQAARAMFSPLTKPILASPPLFHKHSNPLLYYYTINYKANVFCPWGFSALEVFHWATQYAENCLRTHPKQRPYLAHLSISTIFAWKGCIKNSNGKWGLTNQSSLETSVFCCLFAAVKYRLGQCLAIWDLPALSLFNPPLPSTPLPPPAP